MNGKKRYVVTADFYILTETDEEAIKEAKIICRKQDIENDDKCSVISIHEQPSGTISSRKLII